MKTLLNKQQDTLMAILNLFPSEVMELYKDSYIHYVVDNTKYYWRNTGNTIIFSDIRSDILKVNVKHGKGLSDRYNFKSVSKNGNHIAFSSDDDSGCLLIFSASKEVVEWK